MRNCLRVMVLGICLAVIPSLSFAAKTHKVKRSDSLYSLARKYKVTVQDLKRANNLVSAQVRIGDTLVIPLKRPVRVADADTEKAKPTVYKVKRSETLARIAKKTGVSVKQLKRLNHLAGKRVKAGQVLVLREEERQVADAQPREAKRYSLRYADLFSEKDYEQSLADLGEPDPSQPGEQKQDEAKTDGVKQLKSAAYGFLGTRYRFGGNSRNGLDCSAFVQQVFRELDVSLPRSAREQFEVGSEVTPGDLQKGDLVFFRTYASFPSHVGIYLGNNRMIHASSRDRRVVISTLNTQYYRARFIGAKRIAKINPDVFKFDDLLLGIEEESPEEVDNNDTMGISLNN